MVAEVVERRHAVLRPEAELDHLALDVAVDQLARRALGDDLRPVHDHEAVAELLGLVHVVRREDERHALLLQPVEPVPERVAGLGIEAGRRLVEEQELGARDERAGDRQPPLHPARERVDLRVAAVGELDEVEQLGRPPGDDVAREAEEAAVDLEVLPDEELEIEVVLLRHDPEPLPDRRPVGLRVATEDAQRPAVTRARRCRSSASSSSCPLRSGRGSRTSRRARRRSRSRRPRRPRRSASSGRAPRSAAARSRA